MLFVSILIKWILCESKIELYVLLNYFNNRVFWHLIHIIYVSKQIYRWMQYIFLCGPAWHFFKSLFITRWSVLFALFTVIRCHWGGSAVCSCRRAPISPQFLYDRQPPRPLTTPPYPSPSTNGTSSSSLLSRHWSSPSFLPPSTSIENTESGPWACRTFELQAVLLGPALRGRSAAGHTHWETEESTLHDHSAGFFSFTCWTYRNSTSFCCYSTWANQKERSGYWQPLRKRGSV